MNKINKAYYINRARMTKKILQTKKFQDEVAKRKRLERDYVYKQTKKRKIKIDKDIDYDKKFIKMIIIFATTISILFSLLIYSILTIL